MILLSFLAIDCTLQGIKGYYKRGFALCLSYIKAMPAYL